MTERTKWADFPNAQYIDRIIAHLKANPKKWDATYNAARDAAWDAAWDAAYDAAWVAAGVAARGAILALIVWDDCAYLLDQKPEHVKIIALLGHEASILLEPAVIAMYEEILETV